MNGFTKKSVGTLTLGEKLRKLRSDKRMSLNDVSRITKIQIAYLECLENGDYDHMPADVYVKGFLRSYADFLGVDENILIKLFEKEKGIKKNLEKKQKIKPIKTQPVDISSFVFTPRKIIVSVVILLVLTGVFFLYREIDSFASAPNLIVFSPENNSETEASPVNVEGITDKNTLLSINGQQILVGDDRKFRENISLRSGRNIINIKSVNKFNKETEKTVEVNFKDGNKEDEPPLANESLSSSEDETALPAGISLEIKIDPGPVWLTVEADGNTVFSGTMLTGAAQKFSATEKIVINSGRANATFLNFNGKDIGAMGPDAGPVRGVTFTPDTKIDAKIK